MLQYLGANTKTLDKIRDWLYIGSLRDTQSHATLSANGIGAMLQLAVAVPQTDITRHYLPIEDGRPLSPGLLHTGLDFVATERQNGNRVLIACAAGISRSATFTIAALKESEPISLREALRTVVMSHPETFPHPALWKSLCDFYGEPVPLKEMVKICRSTATS